jgi:hypothetical protein
MHGVTPTHFHTDNFSSHVGDALGRFSLPAWRYTLTYMTVRDLEGL